MPDDTKRRFTQADVSHIVDSTMEEQGRREKDRRRLEDIWDEVDRQVAQTPDLRHKMLLDGATIDPKKAWMPEVELPLQSQTLEVLMADARRMTFPQSGPYFQANAALTDEYLARVDFESLIAGANDVPTLVDQDNANKLTAGFHSHIQRQYDFRGHWDLLHMEAFKYGTFVGKARTTTKNIFALTTKGVVRQIFTFPVMIPRSIRNVYLDDSKHNVMMEGQFVGPTVHEIYWRKFEDLKRAAMKGGSDPKKNGWRMDGMKKLEGFKATDNIKVIRVEGDILVPRRSTRALFLPNAIAHIAMESGQGALIRLHFSELDENSYFSHPYTIEDMASPYGTGPLMKGMPIQKAAVEALTRLMEWAALDTQPPVKHEAEDPFFSQTGGPVVAPGQIWATIGNVEPVQIGNGSALFNLYVGFLQQYADLTGVNAPRLGQQTVSHTTAFAKDVENQRGTARTVDYVTSVLNNPMGRWLELEYRLGRKFRGKQTIFIEEYGGFVEIESKHLPDLVSYEVFGASGPAEERQEELVQSNAVQIATQIELLKIQLEQQGAPQGEKLDLTAIQKEALRKGFKDVDKFFVAGPEGVPSEAQATGIVQPALTSSTDTFAA